MVFNASLLFAICLLLIIAFRNFLPKRSEHPEDDFTITITPESVTVEHPKRKTEMVEWADIKEIRMVNTDSGPHMPDVWLMLVGDKSGCLIPQGTKGFNEVYDIVSKYEGFNYKGLTESMDIIEQAQTLLWKRK